jgi:hypothetical protein
MSGKDALLLLFQRGQGLKKGKKGWGTFVGMGLDVF